MIPNLQRSILHAAQDCLSTDKYVFVTGVQFQCVWMITRLNPFLEYRWKLERFECHQCICDTELKFQKPVPAISYICIALGKYPKRYYGLAFHHEKTLK